MLITIIEHIVILNCMYVLNTRPQYKALLNTYGFSFAFNCGNATTIPNNNNLSPAYYSHFNLLFGNLKSPAPVTAFSKITLQRK